MALWNCVASGRGLETDSRLALEVESECNFAVGEVFHSAWRICSDAEFVAGAALDDTMASELVRGCGRETRRASGAIKRATTASSVIQRTVKRVVGFSRGRNFSRRPIATARIAPWQIPFRSVVIARLMGVISALLHSPRSSS